MAWRGLYLAFIHRAEGLYGRILTEVALQTERSEVCNSDQGQDSPIQANLARLIRCSLYCQEIKPGRNKRMNNFICFPARAQAFNWLSFTDLQCKQNKNNCSKSSFVQTSSMNEGKTFYTGSIKKLVKTTIYEK